MFFNPNQVHAQDSDIKYSSLDRYLEVVDIVPPKSVHEYEFDWEGILGIRSISLEIHHIDETEYIGILNKKGPSQVTVTMKHGDQSLDSPVLDSDEDGNFNYRMAFELRAQTNVVTLVFSRYPKTTMHGANVASKTSTTTVLLDLVALATFYFKQIFKADSWDNVNMRQRHTMAKDLIHHKFELNYNMADFCTITFWLHFFLMPVEKVVCRIPQDQHVIVNTHDPRCNMDDEDQHKARRNARHILDRMRSKMKSISLSPSNSKEAGSMEPFPKGADAGFGQISRDPKIAWKA